MIEITSGYNSGLWEWLPSTTECSLTQGIISLDVCSSILLWNVIGTYKTQPEQVKKPRVHLRSDGSDSPNICFYSSLPLSNSCLWPHWDPKVIMVLLVSDQAVRWHVTLSALLVLQDLEQGLANQSLWTKLRLPPALCCFQTENGFYISKWLSGNLNKNKSS